MHFSVKKKHIKWVGVLLAAEIVAAFVLLYGILATVAANEQQERIEKTAQSVAVSVVETGIVKQVSQSAVKAEKVGKDVVEDAYIRQIAKTAEALKFVAASTDTDIEKSEVYDIVQDAYSWNGAVLSRSRGAVTGPNGKETYYNLDMSGVVRTMRSMGYTDAYWVRSDGCKMLGNYIMVAANLSVHPRGSIVKTSNGLAIVCDTGGFASGNPNQIDVATNW